MLGSHRRLEASKGKEHIYEMGEVEMLEEDPNFSPECLNFLWGPSIKDVHIKGGRRGSAKCRQLRTGGEGVGEMGVSAF